MKHFCVFAFVLFVFTPGIFAQDEAPVLKIEAKSAFVWGEDAPSGAVSSSVQDPLTGNTIHKLNYRGVEVSSRMGFEGAGMNERGTFLNYTITVVNSTDSKLSLRYGGISVDGYTASPLKLVRAGKGFNKKEIRDGKQDLVEIGRIHCITSGFLSSDNFFSADTTSEVFNVPPAAALTVSSAIKDPRRDHAILCSIAGCYPTGTIRYYVRVENFDYVFVWSGRSAVYCGQAK